MKVLFYACENVTQKDVVNALTGSGFSNKAKEIVVTENIRHYVDFLFESNGKKIVIADNIYDAFLGIDFVVCAWDGLCSKTKQVIYETLGKSNLGLFIYKVEKNEN